MKIALVTYSFEVGGVEAFIKHTYDYFKDQGHEVIVLETLKKGMGSKLFKNSGYSITGTFPRFYDSRIQHCKKIAKYLSNFDVAILNDAPFAQAALGLLNDDVIAIPVLHNNHASIIKNALANSDNWDALVSVSPKLLSISREKLSENIKTICIPNGVAVMDIDRSNNLTNIAPDCLRVVFIGNLNHFQKGIFYLPEIFKEILLKFPKTQFDILGWGPDGDELKKRCNSISQDRVIFHGVVANSFALETLRESDVLIMPSHFEGLPIVLLEAMAAGVVPVASLLDNITNYAVTDGVDGRLIEVGNIEGFVNAILELAKNRALLQNMSASAIHTAKSRFSSKVMGQSYLDLVSSIKNSKSLSEKIRRTGVIDIGLLGDFPSLPVSLVRPMRKFLKIIGFFK